MNINDILRQRVLDAPDRLAIITHSGQCNFAALEDNVNRAASMLKASGLSHGDSVLVFQPVSIELYEILLAIFRLGLIAVFVDPQSGRQAIRSCVRRCEPKAFIGSNKAHLLRLLYPEIRRIGIRFNTGFRIPGSTRWKSCQRLAPLDEKHKVSPSHPALITFTSGSTGEPKAAVRSHAFLIAQHKVLEKNIRLAAGQIDLATLPVFVLANLASGVTSLIPNANLLRPGFIKAAPVLKQILQFRPDRSAGSPAFYLRLVEAAEKDSMRLDSFKQIYTGGAPVFPSLMKRLQQVAPDADIVAVYGSTEAEPIAHIDLCEMSESKLSSMRTGSGLPAGHVVDEIQLRIINNSWGQPLGELTQAALDEVTLDTFRTGEIVVSGEHVLNGYLDGQGDEETKFTVDGQVWHRTGDLGYLDSQQQLWLLGRCTARIDDGHGVLYPFAVEAAITDLPALHRSALMQVNGKRVLFYQADKNSTLDLQQLHDELEQRLVWANIDKLVKLDEIPVDKRHNAKIDYPALQAMVSRL